MRELHAWHEAKRDSRRAPDTAADTPTARAPVSPKLEVLRDPAARIAKHLEYRKIVEAAEARYTAGRLKPQEARPENAPPERATSPSARSRTGGYRPKTSSKSSENLNACGCRQIRPCRSWPASAFCLLRRRRHTARETGHPED